MSALHQRFIDSLLQSQWLPREDLERYQRPLLEGLVRHAATQTAFYRDRLAPLFRGGDPATSAIDFDAWRSIKPVTRSDIVADVTALHARSVPEMFGSHSTRRSSGTTTIPLEHRRSQLATVAGDCLNERAYIAHDIDLDGTLALLTHGPVELKDHPEGREYPSWNKARPNARTMAFSIDAPPLKQLEWIERANAAHVMTYPNNMRAIAHAARRRGGPFPKIATLISSGELLDDAARDEIVGTFGCHIIDIYAAREFGHLAFKCPDHDAYHIACECVHLELLDDDGNPATRGESGRIVVTGFYNYAMPFIRYDLGDYAIAGVTSCGCGRGLPTLTQIGGRTRNLFVMPDGSRHWPALGPLSKSLVKFLAYEDIQFIQHDVNLIEIRYVPRPGSSEGNAEEIDRMMKARFHPDLGVRLSPVAEIKRGPGGKIEQFITRLT